MTDIKLHVSITDQTLLLFEGDKQIKQYSISTARNGAGELLNSECTPRGKHTIAEKIGNDYAVNTVFVGRKSTGEIYEPALRKLHPNRDWILTRILWLEGQEEGKNKGGELDTYQRYIYIHGSPDDVEMGKPGSHGCVRMKNKDVIELFEKVNVGDAVIIHE
ncbi:MAG: L,D-transpeptidase [Pseudomonadota bacterium]